MQTDYLTVAEVADRYRVHPDTIRDWANTGKLPSLRTPGGKQMRFSRAALDKLDAERRTAVEAIVDGAA